jgi:hypothetical protein
MQGLGIWDWKLERNNLIATQAHGLQLVGFFGVWGPEMVHFFAAAS